MDPITMSMILGGTGLLKGIGPDKWKEDRQRNLAANTQRYSPWTHLQANPIEEADPFNSTLQGAASGYAQGQNFQGAAAQKGLTEAQMNYYNSMASGGGGNKGIGMELMNDDSGLMSPAYTKQTKRNYSTYA